MKNKRMNKINRVITAWETLAPTKSFGGYALEQFKAKAQAMFDLQDQLGVLDSQLTDAEKRLETATQDSHDAALLVVNAVKGDPDNGEDSPLYAAMGYVRKSDRSSGLSRKVAPTNVVPLAKAA